MKLLRLGRAALAAVVMLLPAVPAFSEKEVFIGAGPNIGFWDVADGHHVVGLYTVGMLHLGSDRKTSLRLDASYSRFWAEGNVGNEDYSVLTLLANMVLTFSRDSSERPYWTLGVGYDKSSDEETLGESSSGLIFGTGVGVRFGWGMIEARFDLARTSGGAGAYVPIFAAVGF
jgi:hypothetical protein